MLEIRARVLEQTFNQPVPIMARVVWADDEASPGLHASFKISASGETLYLVTPEKSIADQVTFADAEEDFSYARSPNGTGGWSWTDSPTFDAVN